MEITVNGIRVNFELEGPPKRPVIVLSHSLATDLTMWYPQIKVLTRHFRVLRYDIRGHGASDAPDRVYSLNQLTNDVQCLLEELGIQKAHFIGLSLGGMIGQMLALTAPYCLLSLVLCDTTSRIPANAKAGWDERIHIAHFEGMAPLVEPTIARWFTPTFRERNPEVVERIRNLIRKTAPQGYIGCCYAISSLNVTDALKKIAVPTMVIVGEDDPGTPVAAARAIHEQIAGSELAIIKSASHLSNVEQPEEFNRRLAEFLAKIGRKT